MSKKIFISKPITEVKELQQFCDEKGFELIAHSFLNFEAIPFNIDYEYDVIFFSSKRGVEFFLKQSTFSNNTKIACVGEGTANELRKHGFEPSFIGEKSGEIESVAADFKSWLGSKKVVFAQAKDSNRSISIVLNKHQYQEVSVYKTIIHSKKIEPCEIYAFTSPSNVDGFLIENNLRKNSKIIAWGNSTEKHLLKNNIFCFSKLKNASISELITIIP